MLEIVIRSDEHRHNDDVVEVIEHRDGSVIALADGAGGTGCGFEAATAIVDRIRAYVKQAATLPEPKDWQSLLMRVDVEIEQTLGESTCVIAGISGDGIAGASVGDSAAWLITSDTFIDLTASQLRKPLLGSGRAQPVAFDDSWSTETLLLASDGLTKYAPLRAICETARLPDLQQAAQSLIDLVRMKSGAVPDDVTVALCRRKLH